MEVDKQKEINETINQQGFANTIADEVMEEELEEIVENIDMAQIFVKFGGLLCLLTCLELTALDTLCRARIASVIGTLAQNNLTVQNYIFDQHILSRLMSVFVSVPISSLAESSSSTISTSSTSSTSQLGTLRTKTIFAISCAVRNHPALETQFIRSSYTSKVLTVALLDKCNLPLLRKVVYFFTALLTSELIQVCDNT